LNHFLSDKYPVSGDKNNISGEFVLFIGITYLILNYHIISIQPFSKMKLKKNIATSEAGLIFNPGTGDSFSVNTIGSEILSLLKENRTRQEIIDSVSSKYLTERNQLEKDLDDFVSQLNEYNLLEN
jgi:hypothetical protein